MADKGKGKMDENFPKANIDAKSPKELALPMMSPKVEGIPKVNIFGASWDLVKRGPKNSPGEEVSWEASSAPLSTTDPSPSDSSEEGKVAHSAATKQAGIMAGKGSESGGSADPKVTRLMGFSDEEKIDIWKFLTGEEKAPAQSAGVSQTTRSSDSSEEEKPFTGREMADSKEENSHESPLARGFDTSIETGGGSTLASRLEANRASRPGGLASATHLELAQDINQVLGSVNTTAQSAPPAGGGVEEQQANEESRRRCNCVIY